MGLRSFKAFQTLRRNRYHAGKILGTAVKTGTVNRFASRMGVARAFRGIELEGIGEATTTGYNAFFQILLTHSALELFMEVYGLDKRNFDLLWPTMQAYEPETVIAIFRENDPDDKFYTFLCEKLNPRLADKLRHCIQGDELNVAYISASIRHIFAHGHLSANVNGVRPRRIGQICTAVSDFMLDYMDSEFGKPPKILKIKWAFIGGFLKESAISHLIFVQELLADYLTRTIEGFCAALPLDERERMGL